MLMAAPHRGFFAAGVVQGLLAMALWVFDLAARAWGFWSPIAWPLPPSWVHSLMLLYGVFGFFVFGFILTAGPRWQKQGETPPIVFRPAVVLMAGGWVLADIGLVTAMNWALALGLVVALAGWSVATAFLWRLTIRSSGRMHIGLMATAHTAGACGLMAFGILAAGGSLRLGPLAIGLGLWAYILPVFVTVLHRMLPFFSQGTIPNFEPRRPIWALVAILAGSVGHGLLVQLDLARWTWLFDLPAAGAALTLTVLWRFRESFVNTLLAVLHVAFLWAGIAFALLGVDSLLTLAGVGGLGLAPVHAMTLGFMSSAMVGMASRVTLGHSGLPIVGDATMWGCFWVMQLAALLRIAGEWLPVLNPGAALLWLLAFAVWGARYAPAYWKPRADGEPG